MEKKPFLESIRLQNFLSYGSEDNEIKLDRLNVLIGPNASGKSNLIEAFDVLRNLPLDQELHLLMGDVRHWVWKGATEPAAAKIEVKIKAAHPWVSAPLLYRLKFMAPPPGFFWISEETIQDNQNPDNLYFQYAPPGDPVALASQPPPETSRTSRVLDRNEWRPTKSVLSQLRDFFSYPEITYLANYFNLIHFFREWHSGPYAPARSPAQTSMPPTHLLESTANLGLVLNNLRNQPQTWDLINQKLSEVYPDLDYVQTEIVGGQVLLSVRQRGLRESIPVTRLSDGTLRYLCLLVILCHPEPPPLVCLEEPELGLYPEALPVVGDLLKAASEKTQLIVTTHSDVLVSSFTDTPESVLICERDENGSRLRRLESGPLKEWLEKYALGDLWLDGRLGVRRW
ncbi:MAG: AAA family ATPase [Desulfomonilaceae bacterium]